MKRAILFSAFIVLMTATMFDVNLSLAPGLSIKNAYLYMILIFLAIEAAISKHSSRIEQTRINSRWIHVPFILMISYAIVSWGFVSLVGFSFDAVQHGYGTFQNTIALKNQLIDHYLFFLVFFYGVRTVKDALWVSKYILGFVVLTNVVTFIDVYNIPDLGIIEDKQSGRVRGPLGQANQDAAFLVFFLPCIAAAIWMTPGLKRLALVFGGVISFALLVLTTSRGAFVGLAGGILVGTMYLRRYLMPGRVVKTAMIVTVLMTVGLVGVSYEYSDLLFERFVLLSTSGDIAVASSGRSDIWGGALSLQTQKPITLIIGYGWNAFRSASVFGSHNTYLEYFFNLGIIGLGLFLVLLHNVINVIKKGIVFGDDVVRVHLMGFLFGFLSILGAIFFTNLYAAWVFVWAYTGIMARLAAAASTTSVTIRPREKPALATA